MKKLVICMLFLASVTLVLSCRAPLSSVVATGKPGETGNVADKKKPGITDLIVAISTGNVSLAQEVIDKGVSVKKNYLLNTLSPMVIAVETGNPDMVELIIKNGGEVNRSDRGGALPLLEAVKNGNPQVVDLLLKAGADPYKEGSVSIKDTGKTVGRYGNYESVQCAPVLYSVKYNKLDVVKCLYLNDVDFNREIKLIKSKPLLVYAIENGSFDVASYMIDNGADITLKDSEGRNAMMVAISGNNIVIVQKLIEYGSPVNDIFKNGSTPLMYACSIKGINPELVKLLVDNGADMNYRNKDQQTPFSLTCLNCNPDAALYLYEQGADIDIPEKDVESNAMKNHFLADYFLARDDFNNAQTHFSLARDYYDRSLSKAKRRLLGVQVGDFFADVVIMATTMVITSPQVQSMASFPSYTNQYNKIYYPSYSSIELEMDMIQYTAASGKDKKAYYKALTTNYKSVIELIDNILECFGKNLSNEELHSEIDKIISESK